MTRRRRTGPRVPLTARCGLCEAPITGKGGTGLCGPCYRTPGGRWWLKQQTAGEQPAVPGSD